MPDYEPSELESDDESGYRWDCDLSYDLPNLSEWTDENDDE